MRKAAFLISAVISATFAFGASAQAKPEKSIEYRQGVYKVIGWNFGPMAGMMKGEIPYDKEAFAKRAAIVAQMGPLAIEGFGPGTDKGAKTEAKAEIWTKMDDFKTKMTKMNEETVKLAAIAKTGSLDEIKKQFGATGASCKACHDDYKNK
jgi:cytochrome c556